MRLLLLASVLVALSGVARADDLLVPRDYPTIQAAVNAAADFDRVLVNSGDWVGTIDLGGRPLILESVVGPGFTRLRGDGGPILVTRDGDQPGAVLRGFTLFDGSGFTPEGGGPTTGGAVYVRDAWLRIEGCHFLFNHVEGDGGALAAETREQRVELEACLFRGNTAGGKGGGATLVSASDSLAHSVRRNTFRQNAAGGDGGGLHIASPRGTLVTDSAFFDNVSQGHGGGLAGSARRLIPSANIFDGNSAAGNGGGLFLALHVPAGSESALLSQHDRVLNNSADGHGGGFAFQLSAPQHPGVSLRASVLANNTAQGEGGAVWLDVAYSGVGGPARAPFVELIEHCTLVGNRATQAGDAFALHHELADRVALGELVLWDPGPQPFFGTPVSVAQSLVQGGFPGPGNLSADPLFLEPERDVFALRSASPARGVARSGGDLGGLPYSPWANHGHASHGTNGRALMSGEGALAPGNAITIRVQGAVPSGISALVVGAFPVYAPFKKGIVVPFPHIITPYSIFERDGSKELNLIWPAGVPDEAPIYAQYFTMDPSTGSEIAASNAVSATQPSVP